MLTRYAPLAEFEQLQRELSGLFEGLTPRTTITGPRIDLVDGGDHLLARTEVPGVRSDDIEVSVQGQELTLKGRRERLEADGQYVRCERRHGSFLRVLDLPVEVDASNVSATLENGLLTVKLPKAAETQPRKIQITVK